MNAQIAERLLNAGFRPDQKGDYIRDKIVFRYDQSWPFLERDHSRPSEQEDDLLGRQFRRPGFWKPVWEYGRLYNRFDLPQTFIDLCLGCDSYVEGASNFESIVAWAIETANGTVRQSWKVPQEQAIGMTDETFIVQHGRFLQRGCYVRTDNALVLRVCIIDNMPSGVDERRMAWLRYTLLDAQARLRYVRFCVDSESCQVTAEVDFTGAPLNLLPVLLKSGLVALRLSFKWLVASLDLIANAEFNFSVFDVCSI